MEEFTPVSEFGRLLQEYRHHDGMTQIQLADLSTVSVRAIRDLELGSAKRPRRDTVRLLAEALRLGARRRVTFELAAGRDPAVAAFEAVAGDRALPPPRPSGPLFGREAEHRALVDLLVSGAHRLVAVTGLAGVGKTRLTLAAAHTVHETSRLRVLWLPATELDAQPASARPAEPAPTVAIRALLHGADGRVGDLAELVGETALLMVLDGLDRETVSRPVLRRNLAELLAYCPNLRIVLTTPGLPDVAGVHLFPLRPLPVDGSASPGYSAAVELLAWHLRQAQPGHQHNTTRTEEMAQVCRWLDGIPQGLLGAASWSLLMPLAELADFAYRDPLTICSPPARQHAPGGLRADLTQAIAELEPDARMVLELMARHDGELALPELAELADAPAGLVAPALYSLLSRNLVCVTEQAQLSRFRALNTVRSLLAQTLLARSG